MTLSPAASFQSILWRLLSSNITKPVSALSFIAVNPPLIPESPFNVSVARKQGYYNFPPTGPMYLCASIDSLSLENTSTRVIDLNNFLLALANTESDFEYGKWRSAFDVYLPVLSETYYVFLVSYMFGTTKECYINTCRFIRESFPKSIIITGGVQATFDKEEILRSYYADIVCSNEGDLQIQFLSSLIHSYCFNSVNSFTEASRPYGGIYIHDSEQRLVSTGSVEQPSSFDWDLSKHYDEIDITNYYKNGGLGAFSKYVESVCGTPLPYSAVLTKRGCRAHCSFCTVRTFNGKGLRLRSLDSVIAEISHLYSRGIRHIDWLDDDLLYDEEYNLQLFDEISRRFPNLKWTASNGLIGVAITERLMSAMSKSGLLAFKIGVESGNSDVIKNIRKPTTLWRLLDKSALIREYPHIFFSANFIIGFPGETFRQMLDSFIYARRLRCDWSSFYVCQPLKGTDLFSSFQHLMDPRANEETYTKTINPGRSAARGEFAYTESQNQSAMISAGWRIFDLPYDATFDAEVHNEIWFTFNLVANFLDNPCYKDIQSTTKLVHWLKAIYSGYPFDFSMASALSYCYRLLGNIEQSENFASQAYELLINSIYWQQRVRAFPELLILTSTSSNHPILSQLKISLPNQLIPDKYNMLFKQLSSEREQLGWR